MSVGMRSKLPGLVLVLAGAVSPATARAQAVTGAFAQVPFGDVQPNPTGLKMYYYIPTGAPTPTPIVVVLHYCTGTASAMQSWLKAQADEYEFMLVFPDSNRTGGCWDVASNAALKHPSESDPLGIVSMVNYAAANLGGDASKVFATGQSSGAMMTDVLLATYPEVFQGGAAFMGVPAGCFATGVAGPPAAGTATTLGPDINSMGYWNNTCATGGTSRTGAQWGDLVRGYDTSYTGARPRMLLYHGETDGTLAYPNFAEDIKQWTNVLDVSSTPAVTEMPLATWKSAAGSSPAHWGVVWTRTRYGGTGPQAPVEAIHVSETGHSVVNADFAAAEAVRFFGLGDSTAPTAPANLASSNVTAGGVTLTWDAATDDVGVTNYVVLRLDTGTATPMAWPTTHTVNLAGLTPSIHYTFEVVAVDRAGNISAGSGSVDVSTPADTTPPTAPSNVKATSVTATAATLTWTASTDDVGVTGYAVLRKDGGSWTQVGEPTATTLALTGLTAGTAYTFEVVAKDGTGHQSSPTTVQFTTLDDSGGGGGGCSQGAPSGLALLAFAAAMLLWRRRRTGRPQ